MLIFSYQQLEKATRSFGCERILGKGSHGCVYKGVLKGGKLVAVKKQKDSDDPFLKNEIEILSKLQSPRVVNLVGIGHREDSKETLLVVEFMANGTLHDLLHSPQRKPNLNPNIGWLQRVHVAVQIAKAIRDLHGANPPVIHRDIKSSNVFIDCKWNARLGDFGLALSPQNPNCNSPPAGTLGYLDPTYDSPCGLSPKNDVFSFGILLLEVISGRKPMDVDHSPISIVDWALPLIQQKKFHLLCDSRIGSPRRKELLGIKRMAVLATLCVSSELQRRPSMNEVVNELQNVRRSIVPLPVCLSFLGILIKGGKGDRV